MRYKLKIIFRILFLIFVGWYGYIQWILVYPDFQPEYDVVLKSLHQYANRNADSALASSHGHWPSPSSYTTESILITKTGGCGSIDAQSELCQQLQKTIRDNDLESISYNKLAGSEQLIFKYPAGFFDKYQITYEYVSSGSSPYDEVLSLKSVLRNANMTRHYHTLSGKPAERINYCEKESSPHWYVCASQVDHY